MDDTRLPKPSAQWGQLHLTQARLDSGHRNPTLQRGWKEEGENKPGPNLLAPQAKILSDAPKAERLWLMLTHPVSKLQR